MVQLRKIVAKDIGIGLVRFVRHWNGNDRPAGFAEYADTAGHVRRRGNQAPSLARRRTQQRLGEDHILISVAGFVLEKNAAGVQPLLGKEKTRRIGFGESRKMQAEAAAAATEHQLGVWMF